MWLSACGAPAAPDDAAAVQSRQAERLARLEQRHATREKALATVNAQRDRALAELQRIEEVRGRSAAAIKATRYGSDGTGDPDPWVQSGARATPAPNTVPATLAAFSAAQSSGQIRLVGAARQSEISEGLIDDRVLRALLALSANHRLEVNSLRVSHPRSVQDDLGTPTESNHVYGRAADISAVDGVQCESETRRAPYRTLLDNPPPVKPGPCLVVAAEAAALGGDLALGETIFYWRVPAPSGVSLPNHDDHVHLGYRNYPGVESDAGAAGAASRAAADLQVPEPGDSHTLGE